MARSGDTKDEILRTASRLLLERGFNAFSYGHIAEALGVKPAAIHYHFPSKTDLGVALVERFRSRYQLWMEDAETLAPWEQLRGFFGIYRRFLDEGRVCPGGALQAEYGGIPPEMQAAVKKMLGEVHHWLAGVLERGREGGAFRFAGPAESKAAVIGAAVQGALQTARTLGKDHFHATVAQLELELGDPTDVSVRRGGKGS